MDDQPAFDPSKRRLCPDGNCIGVIGADGRCGECGRAAGANGSAPTGAAFISDDHAADAADTATTDLPRASTGDASGFDPDRRLCPDGSCVGVIGANGTCGVCGRMAG